MFGQQNGTRSVTKSALHRIKQSADSLTRQAPEHWDYGRYFDININSILTAAVKTQNETFYEI